MAKVILEIEDVVKEDKTSTVVVKLKADPKFPGGADEFTPAQECSLMALEEIKDYLERYYEGSVLSERVRREGE